MKFMLMNIYQNWGFRSSPFETRPLPATEEGKALLIGREEELSHIGQRLLSPSKIVTVEGRNGIGKTSVINVASFLAFQSFLDGNSDQLLVPCDKVFQLVADRDIGEFKNHVFHQVALTLIKHANTLNEAGRGIVDITPVEAWLTSPLLESVSNSISITGIGIGRGRGTSTNNSPGFVQSGFDDLIRSWLAEIFPQGEGGGIVCVIDNLELLRASEAARHALEALRDEILTIPGLRWIICGSTGIVRTLASTPRLQGYLHSPIEISDFDQTLAGQILESRVGAYKNDENAYLPIIASDFSRLYHVLQGSIRDTFSSADDFCNWVVDIGDEELADDGKHQQFASWLRSECKERLDAIHSEISNRSWQLFKDIVGSDGQCSPGSFKEFKFESQQAMRSQVLKLEAANLVQSVRDKQDNRRKTILVTSNGWMVNYAAQNEELPFPEDTAGPSTSEEE